MCSWVWLLLKGRISLWLYGRVSAKVCAGSPRRWHKKIGTHKWTDGQLARRYWTRDDEVCPSGTAILISLQRYADLMRKLRRQSYLPRLSFDSRLNFLLLTGCCVCQRVTFCYEKADDGPITWPIQLSSPWTTFISPFFLSIYSRSKTPNNTRAVLDSQRYILSQLLIRRFWNLNFPPNPLSSLIYWCIL